ncbi:sensor histidine kinase [Hoyosella subflava]|uniref:ATPase domain protein n=1 Tax=Hoyosella subflava (strain DSM 45089 / JCM 17490 / NBRC 109087 / DQS3-9A1) TaxID=443218 RepID=F6EJ69_HOYSD|nr:ATP-binding protein [Hoyosella subflava]AEF41301.1 ATPase domain protein [Hoyosella subflava DQS3-9A1]
MQGDAERGSAEKLARSFAQFIGWGAVFYAATMVPLVMSQVSLNPWWWTPLFVVLMFGTSIALIPVSRWGSYRALKRTINLYAVINVLASVSWLLTWTGERLPTETGTWISYFPGLAAVAGAIIWRLSSVLVYVALVTPLGTYTGYTARWQEGDEPLASVLVGGVLFSLLFAAAVFALVRSGRLLDATARAARVQAVQTSVTEARTAERRRVNALIHDGVMATLIAAARTQNCAELARQASSSLGELKRAREDDGHIEAMSPHQFLTSLRATVSEIEDSARLVVTTEPQGHMVQIPAHVTQAFSAGVAESLRNVQRHAGLGANCEVRALVGPGIRVDVVDDGAGFETKSVPAHRLGLRGSIRDRFAQLEGGSSYVESARGRGTLVSMRWNIA